MIQIALFAKLSQSGLDGVEFSSDKKVLISAPERLKNYIVPKECEIILGGDSELKSSFLQCINGIKTLGFEPNSKLRCIYPYVFKGSSLESVDMSNCNHLEQLNTSVFDNSIKLTQITLPEGLKSILAGSLAHLQSLQSIKIPDTVEEIEGYIGSASAMMDCKILSEVIITENSNLVTIGDSAFAHTAITSFYIPKNASNIALGLVNTKISSFTIHPENKFYNFDGDALLSNDNKTLHYLKYEEGMVYNVPSNIKIFAPFSCRSKPIKSIVFSAPLEKIDFYVFGGSTLETFTFPEGITTIFNRMFLACQQLTEVRLTSSITRIDSDAFNQCNKLKTINLFDCLSYIGDRAFYGCLELTNFKCPKNLTVLGTGVFHDCKKLVFDKNGNEKFNIENGILFVDGTNAQEYFGDGGEIVIPPTCTKVTEFAFNIKTITKVTIQSTESLEIMKNAFAGTRIEEITLPKCLQTLGEGAFLGIPTLKKVVIHPESELQVIEKNCFNGDYLISSFSFSNNIKIIKENAFYRCDRLTIADLTSTKVETIEKEAFGSSGLTSITIPSTVKTIGESCFASSNLETVVFQDCPLTVISEATFSNCERIKSVEFSDNITTISTLSFKSCTNLTSIVFPLHIKYIRVKAFDMCTSLKSIKLKHNCDLETIEGRAFNGCNQLKDIIVDENDEKFFAIDGYLMDKNKTILHIFLPSSKTTIFIIPATIQKIGNYAFCDCKYIRTVVIPEGNINSVGYSCFKGCTSLSSLYFPPTLEDFGSYAFEDCSSLICGSVVYPHHTEEGINNAIAAGIPKIAFDTECISAKCMTCNSVKYTTNLLNIFSVIALLVIN